MTESKNALEDCRELSNRGHAYKLSKTAEVTGTVLWHVAHRTLPPPIKMSDTEAKVDEEKNVDNDIVQEVEAEKEDANVDVKNASNEIEVEKKDDESNATPFVNKSADIALRTRVGGSPIAKKQVKMQDVEDKPVVDDVQNDLEIEKIDSSQKDMKEKKTLPPAQPHLVGTLPCNISTCTRPMKNIGRFERAEIKYEHLV